MKKRLFALLLAMLMLVSVCAFASCDEDDACTKHVDENGDEKCDNCGEAMPDDNKGEEPDREDTYKIEFVYYGVVYENEMVPSEDDPEKMVVAKDELGRPKRVAKEQEVNIYTLDIIQNTAPTAEQVAEIKGNKFTYGGVTVIAWYDSPEKTNACDLDTLLASEITGDVKLYAELRTEVEGKKGWHAGDNITWEITNRNNQITLKFRGDGAMYDFTYPELAPWYFDENGERVVFTKIDIGSGITNIGSYAFYDMGIIETRNISVPDTVTSIGDYAFAYSRNLKAPILNENIKTIGRSAFEGCNAFYGITIPDSVETIGGYAFYNCLQYETLVLGTGVKEIGEYAFASTSASAHMYIYYRGTAEQYAEIKIALGNTKFYNDGAYLYYLVDADSEEAKKAGPYWIYNKKGVPKHLSFTIRYYGETNKLNIKKRPIVMTDYVFIDSDGTGTYSAENIANVRGIVYRGYKFESWGGDKVETANRAENISLDDYINGDTVTGHMNFQGVRGYLVGDDATYHYDSDHTLTINGQGSTWDFEGVGDPVYAVSVDDNVTKSITVVKFSEGITRLGANVLAGLPNIVYIELPSTITEVHPSAFAACPKLAAIYYDGTVLCTGLDSLVDTVAQPFARGSAASAGQNGSFWDRTAEGIRIAWYFNDGVLTVGGDDVMPDFKANEAPWLAYTNVKELTFAINVVKIGEMAFAGMTGIEKITLHEQLTSIPRSAFENSGYWNNEANWDKGALMAGKHLLAFDVSKMPSDVTYATIPQATKFIMADAFKGAENVKELVLPAYIDYIDPTAFAGLTSLETIYYYGQNINAWNTLINIPDGWGDKVLYRATSKPKENPEKFWRNVNKVPTTWDK